MYLTQEEMVSLSDFLNSLPMVTKEMGDLAVKLKEILYAVPISEVEVEVIKTKKVAKTKTAVKKTVKKHATKSHSK